MGYYQDARADDEPIMGSGLIHAYYGAGVGKTTRSVGLAVRGAGAGYEVSLVQFMKNGRSGEVAMLRLLPRISYYCPGRHPFIRESGPQAVHYEHAAQCLARALAEARRPAQILICDEILNTLLFEVLRPEQIRELMDACRGRVELVMTGADAPAWLLEEADYATEFIQRKHPYQQGLEARRGVEF